MPFPTKRLVNWVFVGMIIETRSNGSKIRDGALEERRTKNPTALKRWSDARAMTEIASMRGTGLAASNQMAASKHKAAMRRFITA